jgi:hypothetical protein
MPQEMKMELTQMPRSFTLAATTAAPTVLINCRVAAFEIATAAVDAVGFAEV